jgi:hypothetical protein
MLALWQTVMVATSLCTSPTIRSISYGRLGADQADTRNKSVRLKILFLKAGMYLNEM